MKEVKFKDQSSVLKIAGRDSVHAGNLTLEVYESLVKENSNYESLFVVTEEKEKERPKKAE